MTMTSARTAGGTKQGVILSGAVRDVYSREILFFAQPSLVFAQFVDRRTELNAEPGDTIKFTKYFDVEGDALLSEVENITVTNIAAHQVHIAVQEYGKGISQSERLIRTAWDDVRARSVLLLGQHYGRTVDTLIQNHFRSAGSLRTVIVGGHANRAALTATDTMDVQSIKDAVEILAVEKAPGINGSYVCVVHPHVARGLRDDSEWIEAHKYTQPGVNNIYRGEIGMMEGVRFVQTTNVAVIDKSGNVLNDRKDTGENQAVYNSSYEVYQSPLFGANAVGWAEALPVQFRMDDSDDFGRTRKLAWYSIMGAGQIRPENSTIIESI